MRALLPLGFFVAAYGHLALFVYLNSGMEGHGPKTSLGAGFLLFAFAWVCLFKAGAALRKRWYARPMLFWGLLLFTAPALLVSLAIVLKVFIYDNL